MYAVQHETSSNEAALIACSDAMKQVLRLAERAASSDATVLVQGETGTGKEVVARYIHQHSRRREGPFVPVNCGAYTDSLLASELFGHVRGAFTGAVSDRAGVFEAARNGTVFLDEIGTMSPTMQVKVTRVLQEKRVLRVGASTEMDIDARVVAATNAELAEMVNAKTFREDLYYRVKVVSCRIPPLRERRDDIKPLVDHYLGFFSRKNAKQGLHLSEPVEQRLLNHDWPGNVRQLRAEVEQLVTMADSNTVIGLHQLSEDFHRPTFPPSVATSPEIAPPGLESSLHGLDSTTASYQEMLDAWTSHVLADRLERCGGNISKTAQSLAISRSTMYALLKKYGMHGQDD